FWAGLAGGTCTIKPATLVETDGFRSRIAAEIPADVVAGLPASPRRSRGDRLALAAAREALADADLEPCDRRSAALVVGAVGGGMYEGEAWYWEEARRGRLEPHRGALRSILPNAHAETLGARLGIEGPKETLVMACASGAAAIALAADLIRRGVVAAALCGGGAAVGGLWFMGVKALAPPHPEPGRPLGRGRRGMSIGEGAAFLVLEDALHCRARGGRVYATFLGAGMTTDAHHVTAPHPEGEGMIRAMRLALDAARVAPGEVGYVNAHGTATPQN